MKLSDRHISEAENLWIEAAGKEFLTDMVRGTLEERLYKNYMIQDYLYLKDYISFMMSQLNENGIFAGLTALLQCSWNYAYIARVVSDRYPDELAQSKYRGWFDAYTAKEYIDSNQSWIDMLDKRTENISIEETECLCGIFKTCAQFENKLWDSLRGF